MTDLKDSSAEIVMCHEEIESLRATNAALLEALEMLTYANNCHGTCACGYDGKLTSDLCPIHGIGACKATEAINKAKEE